MAVTRPPRTRRGGTGSAGARSRAATRERLLESARSLFAERGLHGVTTHDIAHHAGVAAGTFYLHFADKRTLFAVIARDSVAVLRERLEKAVTGRAQVPDLVRAHAEAMIGFAEEQRDLVRILFSADSDAAAVSADVLDELAGAIALKRRERASLARDGTGLDPAVTSQALVGMWARVVGWWAEDPSRAPRDVVIETLSRIQLSGTQPG